MRGIKITGVTTAVVEANYDYTFVRVETDWEGLCGTGECFFAPGLTTIVLGSNLLTRLPLPLSPAARQLAAAEPDLPARLATAGDDYELLFTAPPKAADQIRQLSQELGLPITAIGRVEKGAGVRLVDGAGKEVSLAETGYRHF